MAAEAVLSQIRRTQSANRFNNFHQREYDYSQLEKQLLEKQMMDH
ncbi:MAG: hypothetical protein ACLUOI_30110 [Eisenbergiella sp.]